MSASFELNAETRRDMGKGASRRLRREDKVPAVLYGGDKDATAVTLNHKEMAKNLENEAFYSHILTVHLDGKAEKAVLKDVQRHPFKPRIIHVDLQRVSETSQIRIHVPLHFINQEQAPGVKLAGGIVNHLMNNVEVSCLAKDLPEYIEVNCIELGAGQSIHLSGLALPAGVTIPGLVKGGVSDLPVVTISIPRGAIEEETSAAAAPAEAAAATPAASK